MNEIMAPLKINVKSPNPRLIIPHSQFSNSFSPEQEL